MTIESSLENLLIYYHNLSVYYVLSVIITLVSVIFVWWHNKSIAIEIHQQMEERKFEHFSRLNRIASGKGIYTNDIISEIKKRRQSLLAEKLASKMTVDQLREEQEAERRQLEAIFDLLQTEEDKFQVNSLEELEDQLKLYRH